MEVNRGIVMVMRRTCWQRQGRVFWIGACCVWLCKGAARLTLPPLKATLYCTDKRRTKLISRLGRIAMRSVLSVE